MISNRSVPADVILPHIYYQNLPEAIAWLTRNFGFKEHFGAIHLEGHCWLFSRHAQDISPESWGAILAQPDPRD